MGTEEIRDRLEDDALKRQPEEENGLRKDQETRNGEIEEDKGHGTCTEDTSREIAMELQNSRIRVVSGGGGGTIKEEEEFARGVESEADL